MRLLITLLSVLVLSACQTSPAPVTGEEDAPTTPTAIATSLVPSMPDGVITLNAPEIPVNAPVKPLPSPTAAQPDFEICSPLEDVTLEELSDIVSNPFLRPRPGLDDGHHGVDLAFYSRGERKTMLGLPVHALLAGKVAAVILARPPYGNAVIIETPVEAFPKDLLAGLASTPQPTPVPGDIRLLCPTPQATTAYDNTGGSSLYVLYAHLNLPPLVDSGDEVTCGQPFAEVGTSGSSVNPHLHLETRWGPAGVTFSSMAHYEIAATDEERTNYCSWRVSGEFDMTDPMLWIDAWNTLHR